MDKCLRCSASCMVKARQVNTLNGIMVALDTNKFWGVPFRDTPVLSVFICTDCGYSEFRLDKEHLEKLKLYSALAKSAQ